MIEYYARIHLLIICRMSWFLWWVDRGLYLQLPIFFIFPLFHHWTSQKQGFLLFLLRWFILFHKLCILIPLFQGWRRELLPGDRTLMVCVSLEFSREYHESVLILELSRQWRDQGFFMFQGRRKGQMSWCRHKEILRRLSWLHEHQGGS